MAICDRHGLPLAVHVASASPYEPHLVPATLDARFLPELPTRLIGDRGYDSDALDATLRARYGIEMIAAHRRGRRRDARWSAASSRQAPLENRTALRLAPQLPPSRDPLGISCRELSRPSPTRLCADPAQAFMRWLLGWPVESEAIVARLPAKRLVGTPTSGTRAPVPAHPPVTDGAGYL